MGRIFVQDGVWDYSGDYPLAAVTDPSGPPSGSERIARGGAWYDSAPYVRLAYRSRNPPESHDSTLGFRLARSAPK